MAKTFDLRKDAERWERDQRRLLGEGRWVRPSTQTLNQYLDDWLELTRLSVRARTHDDYTRILRLYVRSELGQLLLRNLSTHALRHHYLALSERGLSPRTVHYAHAVLRLALNTAVADGVLLSNPASAKRLLPKLRGRKQGVLSRQAVKQLLQDTAGTTFGVLWNVLLFTGMRPGEALALQWQDVDWEAETIRVDRTLVPQRADPVSGATWRFEPPKTELSRRTIPLLPATSLALRQHRIRSQRDSVPSTDLVFAAADGRPIREDVAYRSLQRALSAAGLPAITLYQLRHTAATLLLEAGVPMKVVQERLGHASMMLTADVYSHVSPGLQGRAVNQLAAYVGAA